LETPKAAAAADARGFPLGSRQDVSGSEFDTLRGLVRIPFEHAEDKVNVPGVVPLIRGLRSDAAVAGRAIRIYFVTASPPQIGKAIKQKFTLDGIEHDGIVFKNQLRNIVRGRFRGLREHVGFKLEELLRSRLEVPQEAREILFGDDWESDPVIYSVYADVVAGKIDAVELGKVLSAIRVEPRSIAKAQRLAEQLERHDAVEKIYINLERRTPVQRFRSFGSRLVPAFNYFQTASCLHEDGYLSLTTVAAVARELSVNASYTPQRLANSLADVARRGHLRRETLSAIRKQLERESILPSEQHHPEVAAAWSRIRSWWSRRKPQTPGVVEAMTIRFGGSVARCVTPRRCDMEQYRVRRHSGHRRFSRRSGRIAVPRRGRRLRQHHAGPLDLSLAGKGAARRGAPAHRRRSNRRSLQVSSASRLHSYVTRGDCVADHRRRPSIDWLAASTASAP
jgi:hypothetical protein